MHSGFLRSHLAGWKRNRSSRWRQHGSGSNYSAVAHQWHKRKNLTMMDTVQSFFFFFLTRGQQNNGNSLFTAEESCTALKLVLGLWVFAVVQYLQRALFLTELSSVSLVWFQWFCRPVLWSSSPSSSLMERSSRPTTSSTGATGSAGEPPSSCWAEASSSACARTYMRTPCTELSLLPTARPLDTHTHTDTNTHTHTGCAALLLVWEHQLDPSSSFAMLLSVIFSQVSLIWAKFWMRWTPTLPPPPHTPLSSAEQRAFWLGTSHRCWTFPLHASPSLLC